MFWPFVAIFVFAVHLPQKQESNALDVTSCIVEQVDSNAAYVSCPTPVTWSIKDSRDSADKLKGE